MSRTSLVGQVGQKVKFLLSFSTGIQFGIQFLNGILFFSKIDGILLFFHARWRSNGARSHSRWSDGC